MSEDNLQKLHFIAVSFKMLITYIKRFDRLLNNFPGQILSLVRYMAPHLLDKFLSASETGVFTAVKMTTPLFWISDALKMETVCSSETHRHLPTSPHGITTQYNIVSASDFTFCPCGSCVCLSKLLPVRCVLPYFLILRCSVS